MKIRELEIEDYESVVEVIDEASGLHAIIALHDTTLGPALGGIRAYPYSSFEQALEDALRLAKGMTYKSATVKSGTGGGKSVIITDNKKPKSPALLHAFAEAVNRFEGHYICAEDVGVSLADLEIISEVTRFAVGLPHPNSSGDPAPFTAQGTYRGIQAVCKELWGSDSVAGRTIAIQGVGAAGMGLARYLFWAGAKLIVADVNEKAAARAAKEFGAEVVSPSEILKVKCDIFAPCALGAVLNSESIPLLNCKAVAGTANNQLLTDEDGYALMKRGILYAPDYVINAGGLLNVCEEISEQGYHPTRALQKVHKIYDTLLEIFAAAKKKNKPPHIVAAEIADYNLEHEVGKRTAIPHFVH